jgi:hypothetical protein
MDIFINKLNMGKISIIRMCTSSLVFFVLVGLFHLNAMLTIVFIIADTVGIFVLCGWELSILETIIIIMSVGLSVDFSK